MCVSVSSIECVCDISISIFVFVFVCVFLYNPVYVTRIFCTCRAHMLCAPSIQLCVFVWCVFLYVCMFLFTYVICTTLGYLCMYATYYVLLSFRLIYWLPITNYLACCATKLLNSSFTTIFVLLWFSNVLPLVLFLSVYSDRRVHNQCNKLHALKPNRSKRNCCFF